MQRVLQALLAVCFLGLGGCGRKGPLYLPRPAVAPAPSPAAATPSVSPAPAAHAAQTAP